MKRIIKIILLLLLILFSSLIISNYNNRYTPTNTLTNEAIKRYEKDLSEGKPIDINNYIVKEKDYNNKISKITLSISRLLDKYINISLRKLLKYLIN